MKISVIGTGYVWLIQTVWLAKIGFSIQAIDLFEDKIEKLKSGIPTIYENGLEALLQETMRNIHFTTDIASSAWSDIIFLCVGTPQDEEWKTDLTYIKQAGNDLKKTLIGNEIIVIKSTVPASTNAMMYELLGSKNPVVSNPEFLREWLAIEDFFTPDRVVLGFKDGEKHEVIDTLMEVYWYFSDKWVPILQTNWQTAELIKYAANAFLATKITFINEIARLSDSIWADINDVAKALWMDHRIGNKFLNAWIGYGGSCFPKDVKSLIHQFHEQGLGWDILTKVDETNTSQVDYFMKKVWNHYWTQLNGKTIWVFGVAFKPDTDDLRESKALVIINRLIKAWAMVQVFDYNAKALENFEKYTYGLATGIRNFIPIVISKTFLDMTKNADFLILTLEDKRVLDEDFDMIANNLKDKTIFDGKNILHKDVMKNLWFEYMWVGC